MTEEERPCCRRRDRVFDIQAAVFVPVAVKSHSCSSWCFQRLSLVGFLDSGNVNNVAVEESQQFSYFSLILFALHCFSRKQLVGVGVETGRGSF